MEDLLEGLQRPIVADIGSGNNPFPLANLLVDLHIEDNRHRANGENLVRDGRRFIQADVEHLPFPDRSLDFVWCRDVLEHCSHPDRALAEILRVAKHVYIFCPTMAREQVGVQNDPKGWSTHLWFVVKRGPEIKFIKKANYDARERGVQVGNAEYVMIDWHAEAKCGDSLPEGQVL